MNRVLITFMEISVSPGSIELQNFNAKRVIICWRDLKLKTKSTCYIGRDKIILRDVNGTLKTGTMTALMGPSGAGKSSLLKALMSLNKNMITKESKFYVNRDIPIRSAFIAQDVRQHLIPGLTVEQSLYYASKVKNCSVETEVDHKSVVETMISEFSMYDIRHTSVEKCSSGEQKKCVLALELCAIEKPNLLCVDEPTSCMDSLSGQMVCSFTECSSHHKK